MTVEGLRSLTASFEAVPQSHDGKRKFTVRLRFSEGITTNFKVLRDEAISTTGGSVTKSSRIDGRTDLWEIRVKPSGIALVTLTLNPSTDDCSQTGSLCTDDGRALSNSPSVTVYGPLLTAWFESVPASHDGTREFIVQLRFSEDISTDPIVLRNQALSATGGTVTNIRRIDRRDDLWEVYVKPAGNAAITVTLNPTTNDCEASGSVCTADGRALSNSPSETVDGPPAVGASANGTMVTLSWAHPRDDFGSPSVRDYAVRVNGQASNIVSVELSGTTGWIILASPASPGDAVSVAYLGSAMHPLAEATGRLRSRPWDGLVARNLTGIDPSEPGVAFLEPRSPILIGEETSDIVKLDGSELGLSEIWEVERLTALERPRSLWKFDNRRVATSGTRTSEGSRSIGKSDFKSVAVVWSIQPGAVESVR